MLVSKRTSRENLDELGAQLAARERGTHWRVKRVADRAELVATCESMGRRIDAAACVLAYLCACLRAASTWRCPTSPCRSAPSVGEPVAGALTTPGADESPLHERLSHREYQVFRLLSQGRSVGQIAQALLAANTVSTYRARILDATAVRNDVELALCAVRHGLL